MAKLAFHAISGMAAACCMTAANAEVTNTADNGFTVQHQAVIAGGNEAVWKAMIAPSRTTAAWPASRAAMPIISISCRRPAVAFAS